MLLEELKKIDNFDNPHIPKLSTTFKECCVCYETKADTYETFPMKTCTCAYDCCTRCIKKINKLTCLVCKKGMYYFAAGSHLHVAQEMLYFSIIAKWYFKHTSLKPFYNTLINKSHILYDNYTKLNDNTIYLKIIKTIRSMDNIPKLRKLIDNMKRDKYNFMLYIYRLEECLNEIYKQYYLNVHVYYTKNKITDIPNYLIREILTY